MKGRPIHAHFACWACSFSQKVYIPRDWTFARVAEVANGMHTASTAHENAPTTITLDAAEPKGD
jgi:hypothetical protein